MKKAAITVSALLVCGALAGILCMKDEIPAAPVTQTTNVTVAEEETTRQPAEYIPAFTPVVVPEEIKQHYTVNPKAAQVITGNSGTMLLIPENAFTDKNGNAVTGKVKLELVEGITREDILALNLSTMSDQGMLETGGMIYISAQSETGEELELASGKTIEAEIPALQKKPGMQLWEGRENADGTVTWVNPEPMKESLVEVPVESLADDASVADSSSPEKPIISQNVVVEDFGIFPWTEVRSLTKGGLTLRDTIYRWNKDTIRYEVYNNRRIIVGSYSGEGKMQAVDFSDKKFEHTNISTAEFRSRLPYIREACSYGVSRCYADHPNRPLWKSDAAAADTLEKTNCPLADVFRQFAKMKQGKVDPQDPNTVAALDAARKKSIENYSKRVAQQQQMYSGYSFGMKKLGWVNCDALYNAGSPISFNAHLDGIDVSANPRVTLLIPGRNIMISGYRRPNGNYAFTHGETEPRINAPKGETAYVLAQTEVNGKFYYGLKKFVFAGDAVETVNVKEGSKEQMELDMGNVPQEEKRAELKIIDDWYTRSISNGNGCACSNGGDWAVPVIGGAFGVAK